MPVIQPESPYLEQPPKVRLKEGNWGELPQLQSFFSMSWVSALLRSEASCYSSE